MWKVFILFALSQNFHGEKISINPLCCFTSLLAYRWELKLVSLCFPLLIPAWCSSDPCYPLSQTCFGLVTSFGMRCLTSFWLCISLSPWLLCSDQSALLLFVPPSHFRHASCCLNMCHDLWGRRDCLAALGFPRATLVPLQQNSPVIAPWELRKGGDRDPGLW